MNDLIEDVESFKREASDPKYHGKGLSVTRALRRAGLVRFFVSPRRLAELAAEGTQVHYVCADIARNDDTRYWEEIGWIKPYGLAFEQFTRAWDFKAELIEHRIEHPSGYFGFLDMAGTIFTSSKKRARKALVEIKRAVPAKPYALQLAAYQEGLAREIRSFKTAARIAVYLRADGTYKAVLHENPFDWVSFQHVLGVATLREQWGLIDRKTEMTFDQCIHQGGTVEFEDVTL